MVREYVGARYVPKFMGTYDATQSYEALCVVDNGLGTSYISKIPTPAGTPLTDTDHWAIYGATSGAIINLQNQIDDINTDLGAVHNDITGLGNDITALENQVASATKPKVLVISDSYTTVTTVKWDEVFETECGITQFQNVRAASMGLSRPSHKLIDYLPSVTITDPDTFTHVLWVGGANDRGISPSTIKSDMSDLKTYLKTRLPNARFMVGFVGWANSYTPAFEMRDTCFGYINACFELGIQYLTGVEGALHDANLFLSSDTPLFLHPNDNGSYAIGHAVANAWLKGDANICRMANASFTPDASRINSSTNVLYKVIQHNNQMEVRMNQITGTWAFDSASGGTFVIGYSDCDVFKGTFICQMQDMRNNVYYLAKYWQTQEVKLLTNAPIVNGQSFILYYREPLIFDTMYTDFQLW